jgi:triosephosphate isomerase
VSLRSRIAEAAGFGSTDRPAPQPVTGRRRLIAGNWKMNLNHLEGIALTQKLVFSLDVELLTRVEVALLPPFVDIRSVQTMVDGDRLLLSYGAQDLSPFDSGAYTGDIGGPMLAKLGCRYVLVGHSERREYHAEDDALVNSKILAAYRNGLTPILCVGESGLIRQDERQLAHVSAQLDAALRNVPAAQAQSLVVAYEPIWAIGTGEVATPEDAQEVCAAIRARLGRQYSAELASGVRVLYGGSVKVGNVAGILAQADIDGALVGGASIDPTEFSAICELADAPAAKR